MNSRQRVLRTLEHKEPDKILILESFGAGIFEMSCRIRGYEDFKVNA